MIVHTVLFLWIFSIPLKNALYQATTILLILSFLVHVFYFGKKEQVKEVWQTYKPLFLLFAAFVLSMILSGLFGISGHKAFSEIPKYLYRYPLILFILFYFYHRSFFSRKWLLTVVLGALSIHALDGVYQLVAGIDLIKHLPLPPDGRVCGAVFNPNPYGLLMAAGSMISIVCFLEQEKDSAFMKRTFYFFTLLLFLFVLFYTQSRAAWVMSGFFMIIYIIMHIKEHGMQKKLLLSLFLIILPVIFLFLTNASLHQRLISLAEGYSANRGDIWLFTLDRIMEHPILGYGVDSFKVLVADTPLEHFAGTHNTFLEILLFTGIIGFSIFIVLVLAALKEGFSKEKRLYGLFFLSYLLLLQFDGSLIRGKIHLSVFIIALFFIYSFRLDRKRSSTSE